MDVWEIVAIAVAAIVLLAAVGWLMYTRKRSVRLRNRFGLEYDRRVSEMEGNRREAESELLEGESRIHRLKSRPLSKPDRMKFAEQWRECQARFVDDPAGAASEADQLVDRIMHTRGYKMDNPEDRLADICAAYPARAADFRGAHEVLLRHRRGEASTEDLRKAFVHFRSLFAEILGGEDEELKRAS
jgi:hypothetical protein